jgi:MFS family permease
MNDPDGSGSPPKHDPYLALRYGSYRSLLIGGLVALIGHQMLGVAIGWELYERTGKPISLGLVGLVQVIPVFLFSLLGGQTADRFSRKYIIVWSQVIRAVSSLALAWLSYTEGPLFGIYVCLFVGGVVRAFHVPARVALLPQILPPAAFSNAVMWNSSTFRFSAIIGHAMGGFVIGWTHHALPVYVIDAAVSLVYVVSVLSIPGTGTKGQPSRMNVESLLAGVRFVWHTKVLLAAITLDMFAVLLGGAVALMPIYAKDILHIGPEGLGCLLAAESIGAIGMGWFLAHLPPLKRAGPAMLLSVVGFGIGIIVFGFSTNLWLSLGALFFCGVFDTISVVVRHTLVQLRTPDEMRGRVSSINTIFIASSNELGQFESGGVAHFFGPMVSVVSGGIGSILVVIGVAAIWPELRRLGPLVEESGADVPVRT